MQALEKLSLKEKIALCSGADNWNTKAFPKAGIPSVFLCDGPHGLRIENVRAGSVNLKDSAEAVCFPAACLTASSWDPALLRTLGAAIAEEMEAEGVSVILGPGVNIKRNPLCGRNFEYFSEDPYLAGTLAAAWICGAQSKGKAACVKHFAANNQEALRMASDSIVDLRTLREIYLAAFELAVKAGKPKTVMCSYNRINGVYSSDSRWLLTEILREEWGFSGLVMTDWGAMNDRAAAFDAGLDLEMPGSCGTFDRTMEEAVCAGALPESAVDRCAGRVLELAARCAYPESWRPKPYDRKAHHALAVRAAQESAVLLKNEGVLPLPREKTVAVIGAFAETPRYQGAGSSYINTTGVVSVLDALQTRGISYAYFAGYAPDGGFDPDLCAEAAQGAAQCDAVLLAVGLPEAMEGEGFDRKSMEMPQGHVRLIETVVEKNPNTVVLLMGGAPVEMPWEPEVRSILNLYLAGEGVGEAAVSLVFGEQTPSGKLAETYPIRYADVPCGADYGKDVHQAVYAEGLYVGYRYYDTAHLAVRFPFGHGLSYTQFAYRDLHVSFTEGPNGQVSFFLKNTGTWDGAEIVQLYVAPDCGGAYRPEKELRGFRKVFLKAGEEQEVSLPLTFRSFACFDAQENRWILESGTYRILIGASSRDIRLRTAVVLEGETPKRETLSDWYRHPSGSPGRKDFETLYGKPVSADPPAQKGTYTLQNSLAELQKTSRLCRIIYRLLETLVSKASGLRADRRDPNFSMMIEMAENSPLRVISLMQARRLPMHLTEGLICFANGQVWRGIRKMLERRPKSGGENHVSDHSV